jgi:hypothetical protein
MNYKQLLTFKVALFCLLISSSSESQNQNLLDLTDWSVGTGSITDFSTYGSASSNNRELGHNHIGENVVLWKATPNTSSVEEGGIYSAYKTIDNTKTYRLSVWIKKTNSTDGITYFGCLSGAANNVNVLNLNGTENPYPYFWYGDLPMLDRWYLLVGYVHPVGYSGSMLGAIYDGVTGEVVVASTLGRDFKFKSTATDLMLRSFLYNDPNLEDRQYLYEPRIEEINGGESTINQLLSLNPNSKLFLSYDTAGNQIQRLYCPDGNMCTPSVSSKESKEHAKEDIVKTEDLKNETKNYSKRIVIFPNPTKGIATIKIDSKLTQKVEFIKLYTINSVLIQEFNKTDYNSKDLEVDLSGKPSGVYFVHIHFNDGSESITKKIIKE